MANPDATEHSRPKDAIIATPAQNLKTALSAFRKGQLESAETAISEALRADLFNVDALYLGAIISHQRGEQSLALSRLQMGLSRAPDHYEMLNVLGNVQKAVHDLARAEKAFRSSLAIKPDYLIARRNLAFTLMQMEQPHIALMEFSVLPQAEQGSHNIPLAKVICLKDSHRLDEAKAALDKLSAANPNENYGFIAGQIAAAQGHYDDAITAYSRAYTDPKNGPQAIKNSAQILHMLDQWSAAQELLSKLAATGSPAALAAISECYVEAGDLKQADSVIQAAKHAHKNAPILQKAESEISLQRGRAQDAYQSARAALDAAPGRLDYMAQFARCAFAAGAYNDVLVAAENALKRVPNDQFWRAMLAAAGRATGQAYRHYFDYQGLVKVYDLPPPEGYSSIEAFNEALAKALSELHVFKAAPLDQSLRLGTQTEIDLRFAKAPEIQAFFKLIDAPIRDYIAHVGPNPENPVGRRNTGNYRFSGAWSVRLGAGGFHVNHVHPMGWISSSYYVQVPKEVENSKAKNGWIQFGQPPTDISDMSPEHVIEPKSGRLVLFPSYMWHGTLPITEDSPRLTLPFDIIPA